jgi:hypothetical protein
MAQSDILGETRKKPPYIAHAKLPKHNTNNTSVMTYIEGLSAS